jgi:DNA-3-methyladenine glycosylase II
MTSRLGTTTFRLDLRPPSSFPLSAGLVQAFEPAPATPEDALRLGVRVAGRPAVLDIGAAPGRPSRIKFAARPPVPRSKLVPLVRWILGDDLDLHPFYHLVRKHPVLGPLTRKLRGLKPTRPASLLQAAVIVITEQQISLAAARSFQDRIVRRFGDEVEGTGVFPRAAALAGAALRDLRRCGLSHRKAEYIRDLARRVLDGQLNLEALKSKPDDEVRRILLETRGWGPWSAEYFLIRGLGRPDALPADDLGLRTIVGRYLGSGRRLSAGQVERRLEPFRPFRGLAAFYMLADWVLTRRRTRAAERTS